RPRVCYTSSGRRSSRSSNDISVPRTCTRRMMAALSSLSDESSDLDDLDTNLWEKSHSRLAGWLRAAVVGGGHMNTFNAFKPLMLAAAFSLAALPAAAQHGRDGGRRGEGR